MTKRKIIKFLFITYLVLTAIGMLLIEPVGAIVLGLVIWAGFYLFKTRATA